jgi:MATE family multidrug resistance protein
MRNRMLLSFVGYLLALAIFVPLLGNAGLWLSLNGFLLFRGLFLVTRVRPKADQTFRLAQ